MRKRLTFVIQLVVILLFFSCDKKEFKNPVDPEVTINAPENLKATQDGEWIKLSWDKNKNITSGFEIERKTANQSFKQIAKIDNADRLTLLDTTITTDIQYNYRIRGYSDENHSPFSEPVSVTAQFPAPTDLEATPISDQVMRLTWKDNCDFEEGFILERKEAQGSFAEIKRVEANETTVNDSGLKYGADYQYRIKSYTEKNQSKYTLSNTNNTILLPPTNLTATLISATETKLTWQDNCDFEDGFRIEKKSGSGFTQIGDVSANSASYTDNSALWDSEQTYRVYAFTATNHSDYSNEITINPAQQTAPTDLQLTEQIEKIDLTWTDNCTFEDGFRIERSDNGGGWQQIADLAANTTEYTDEGLDHTHTYTYRVYAHVSGNYSAYSNEGSGKPEKLLDMVLVEGGTFQMGSNDGDSDEQPIHTVTVSSFYISKYEITNAQYCAFLNDYGVSSDGSYSGTEYIDMDDSDCQIVYSGGQFVVESGKENYPVIEVTWYGARAFCEWAGGRLPTEAEWEYAARGGNQSQGYTYSGSNNLDEVGWYDDNSGGHTHPVGEKQPNELGIYDMSGNVWEWCNDWYANDYYSTSPRNDPQGPSSGTYRVLRGGCWSNYECGCRCASRINYDPTYSNINYDGFRLARTY